MTAFIAVWGMAFAVYGLAAMFASMEEASPLMLLLGLASLSVGAALLQYAWFGGF